MSALPFSPLTLAEIGRRRDEALTRAGIAMVTAHHYPRNREFHVDDAALIVAEYDMWCEASIARSPS